MQQIIVIIILIIVFGIIVWKLYKLFTRKPTQSHRCVGCDAGCALRDLEENKKEAASK